MDGSVFGFSRFRRCLVAKVPHRLDVACKCWLSEDSWTGSRVLLIDRRLDDNNIYAGSMIEDCRSLSCVLKSKLDVRIFKWNTEWDLAWVLLLRRFSTFARSSLLIWDILYFSHIRFLFNLLILFWNLSSILITCLIIMLRSGFFGFHLLSTAIVIFFIFENKSLFWKTFLSKV